MEAIYTNSGSCSQLRCVCALTNATIISNFVRGLSKGARQEKIDAYAAMVFSSHSINHNLILLNL